MADLPPVITIDGPSGSGKGSVAQRVAAALGFNYLDSGALYRALALAAKNARISLIEGAVLAELARRLTLRFEAEQVWLNGEPVGEALRSEECGADASVIAALPEVRQALLDTQRAFRQPPGLVTDGRDMGSTVFPGANLKIFLTASPEVRAQRRHKQLIEKGFDANLTDILHSIRQRDARDAARAVAPLQMCVDAFPLDTSALTVEQAASAVLTWYRSGSPSRVP
ncbi:MAG: (d)CMP kinase [Burkholderiales bacterium]